MIAHKLLFLCALIGLTGASGAAQAQENAIQTISANQQGANVIVKILMKNPVTKPPIGFSINSPARIAIDFSGTTNATGKSAQDIGLGDVRNVNVVQAGERSRLVFNLARPLNYATVVEGNAVTITIDGSGGVATPVNAAGVAVAVDTASKAPPGKLQIRDIDFRRGVAGEGRVVIDLPSNQMGVDVRQQGQTIVVDFLKAGLPDVLRRRMDVGDFGTPVRIITTAPQGDNVRMVIEPKGLWEHSAYQSDTQLVIEVRPVKEEPNKLSQGTQGYRGEKLSLNFQNVEVRSVLQVIADFTGLNIITSDTVSGNLTLRLKDVPWDQALDIVMQAKGLDMRKNGTVIWIAPKDELLTKEKLELEQRAQIAELEPLKTETFQLNYQKAEAFKMVFGLDSGSGDGKNRILSKRGSAAIDPRTNKLIVTDITSKLDEVRKLILITDVATRQVLIEARIVEADDTFSKNLGAKLGFTDLRTARGGDSGYQLAGNTRVGLTGNYLGVGEQTGQATITDGSFIPNSQFVSLPAAGINGLNAGSLAVSLFSAAANRFLNLELSALEADGRGKVISSPRVVTADQQQALIEQGEEIPYQKATSSGATSVEFKKANLKLEVTPQITPDGNIILTVDVNKDSRGAPAPGGFAINTKHVKTNVQVENGGTVVLGGIFTQRELDSVTKIPFFGDLPVVGNLFKTTGRTNDKTELLIFITPKIVADRLSAR
ncbi:type IV pilus secretin PilQ [Actimicrobium sp. CCC2.4]|nr:type IV pilus secretin PilQ [Actimicrobium sp. CCC2.4]MEB0135470.1 type IV pilus secretin PilQ [Actimicrobium sp. CCC2.4]WPX34059.1 type IV pilus secretin PilQ [Actimicrobium sp. CCC2.4]